MASDLLGTPDISVFTSRVLCKLPKTGKEIVWHQDSNYWPLAPPSCLLEGDVGGDAIHPIVASLWLTLDDVTPESGPMEVAERGYMHDSAPRMHA